uniref:PDZ domain-containing protein n=1 Tax=Neogobius melanostomus TaxID=47308 RepID=A0A8C6X0H2_9GOBI
MKRRPEPLRADHNLLAPDTRSLSGVRHCAVAQVNSLPGHIQTAGRSTRRRPESSPNRRLRFEDETEKEAESRYLERQKRRAGQRGQDILVSKPDVLQYVNGQHKAGHIVDSQHNAHLGVRLQLHPTPPLYNQGQILYPIPPARPVISLRTEPIKETYIGVVTYSDSDGGETGEQVEQRRASNTGRRTNYMNHNGYHKQATPKSDLPINPYAPEQTLLPTAAQSAHKVNCSSIFSPSPPTPAHNGKHHDARTHRKRNQKASKAKDQKCHNFDQTENPNEHRASVEKTPPGPLQTQGHARVGESSLDAKLKTSSVSSLSPVESQTISATNSNGRSKEPIKPEHHSPLEPVEGSRLSLRRLFSSVRLGRSRASSLDRTSSRPSLPETEPPGPTKPYGLLKKTPSVQSLTMGSPFAKLRKSASLQNFVTEQKKKDRSENYKPAAQNVLQRCLSVEDVSCPSSMRSVGRILQVDSDGTLLLELSRPKNHTYGFIISRGKGRSDSGVYVENMVDSSTEKLYAGLLAVGDEILEVNEEKVACLSLDQVTHLLTHSSTVTVRVLRQRKAPAR